MEIITNSTRATQDAGEKLSDSLKGGEVVALSGDLGAGKTHFIQGLAKGLGVESRINSPTFIIMRDYDYLDNKHFYHVDLYRLEENINHELENLGILGLWQDKSNIFAIEWAEKAAEFLPENTIFVSIEALGEEKRKIIING